MPPIAPGTKVLVTGANGFLAIHVVKSFLEHGYSVRGTVRSEAKGVHLHKLFSSFGNKFETVVVKDITQVNRFAVSRVSLLFYLSTSQVLSMRQLTVSTPSLIPPLRSILKPMIPMVGYSGRLHE